MKYVNLVINNRSDSTDSIYTYACEDDSVDVGSKVFVPFARGNRLREAYVASLADRVPEKIKEKIKYVEKTDGDISLTGEMVRTALWLRERYLCRYIDAFKCFLPAGEKAKRRQSRDPFEGREAEDSGVKRLTPEQKKALAAVEKAAEEGAHERFLLHGVTGSGKTEIYIRAAEKVVSGGRSVIILVPEISLTDQITDRFIGRFGRESVAVLHSRLTPGERYDQWKKIRSGTVKIAIGARSAVFAPFEDIGLIVVDEEHETTYKSDHTPKYDTGEIALKRCQDHKGILILGSATPSVTTYKRAEEGIYRIIELPERYNRLRLPSVELVDMREEMKSGNRSIISGRLHKEMENALKAERQVILLLNRRGYSTFVSCRECGYVAKCPECGLPLTYHKEENSIVCHYCGRHMRAPSLCPQCGSRYIKYFGSGTEKAEETVSQLFGEFETERVDMDSVRKKGELERKLRAFGRGRTRILIGTQLIAKGLDFKNVGLVGILSADTALNIPDFRSPERTFQLITQAAGRAGRGDEEGKVIIQTYQPEHYAVEYGSRQDYKGFYRAEIKFREYMGYPPFSDMFQMIFTSADRQEAEKGAFKWYEKIRGALDSEERNNVFPPQEAYMSRIKDTYRFSMLIKCPRGKRKMYSSIIGGIKEEERKERKKKYTASADINPYSFA
ncbi:MAG TPA: primosomal protein N' [Candidatus Copromorpha excrementigallinarum]|uniref:Replication restart protein PriA n=1 Tax=Candidatus Allocopromorpha excrementigallinarum TaxID=2840742 RepID=A0A9D1I071_9FIRM|nr:primosomal protein N' [Candidatus Copromorpha excrementigallinarum]